MIFSHSLEWSRLGGRGTLFDQYAIIVASVTMLVAFLDIGGFVFLLSKEVILPKQLFFVLAAAALPVIIFRVDAFRAYLASRLVLWLLVFIGLNLAHLGFHFADGNSPGVAITLQRVQYLILLLFLGYSINFVSPIILARIFLLLTGLLTFLQVFDFVFPSVLLPPGTEGVTPGRAGSTLVNPNKAAEALLVLSVFAMAGLKRDWRVVLLAAVFLGVFLTFSRAGILAWGLLFVFSFVLGVIPKYMYAVMLLVVPLVVSSITGTLEYILSFVDIQALDNLYERIEFFSTLDLTDDSSLERILVARYALDQFFASPVFGAGAGFTHIWAVSDVSVHNQHLLMLAEYGVIGYGLFLWLMVIIYKGKGYFSLLGAPRAQLLLVLLTLFFSLFTHNMFDFLYWLCAFAVLGQSFIRSRA